jgi:hypothetical protein
LRGAFQRENLFTKKAIHLNKPATHSAAKHSPGFLGHENNPKSRKKKETKSTQA